MDRVFPPALGRYKLLSELGRGGMGVVMRARDQRLNREVALKVLLLDAGSDAPDASDLVKRFEREVKAQAAVQHPNVVRIYDTGVQGDLYYFAMELLAGRTVRDLLLSDGPLAADKVIQMGIDLAAGVGELHAHRILHRDLKPHNVFASEDGRYVVMDLGLVKMADSSTLLTADGAIVGTPRYLPPEVVAGQAHDAVSDLYQIGAVLYEAATGTDVFGIVDIPQMLRRIIAGQLEPPGAVRPGVPAGLERVIQWAMAREPRGRPASAAALREALERLRAGKPLPAEISEDGVDRKAPHPAGGEARDGTGSPRAPDGEGAWVDAGPQRTGRSPARGPRTTTPRGAGAAARAPARTPAQGGARLPAAGVAATPARAPAPILAGTPVGSPGQAPALAPARTPARPPVGADAARPAGALPASRRSAVRLALALAPASALGIGAILATVILRTSMITPANAVQAGSSGAATPASLPERLLDLCARLDKALDTWARRHDGNNVTAYLEGAAPASPDVGRDLNDAMHLLEQFGVGARAPSADAQFRGAIDRMVALWRHNRLDAWPLEPVQARMEEYLKALARADAPARPWIEARIARMHVFDRDPKAQTKARRALDTYVQATLTQVKAGRGGDEAINQVWFGADALGVAEDSEGALEPALRHYRYFIDATEDRWRVGDVFRTTRLTFLKRAADELHALKRDGEARRMLDVIDAQYPGMHDEKLDQLHVDLR